MFGVNQVRWLAQIKQLSANAVVLNCVWMLGGGAGRTVVAFGSNLVLMWFLLPEEFGRFALVQATIGLVAGTVNLKISDIIIRESSQELESGWKDILFSAFVLELVMLGIGSLCLLWVVGLWDRWAGILLLSTMASRWVLAESAYYERSFHYKNLALIESGGHLFSQVLTVAGAVLGMGFPVLYVRGLLYALGIFSGLCFVGGMVKFHLRWLSLHDWKVLYRKFRGFWLDGWLEEFFEQLVIVMVGWLAGEKAAGYFFQARRLASTPHNMIAPATEKVAYNYFSHRVPLDRRTQSLTRVIAIQLIPLGVIVFAVLLLANPLIPMVFGPQWEPVAPLLQAMAGMIFAFSPFRTLKAFFMAKNRMRPFIFLGRGIQYATLAGSTLVVLVYHVPSAFTLALGLSVGYVMGSLALFAWSRNLPNE